MPEKSIVFRDNQELQADDFINMQGWMGEALDHVVLDTINDDKAYSGFGIVKSAQTMATVSAGRLYSAGLVYAREEEVALDTYNDLPVVTKRIFAVVAWGQTKPDDTQPRDFLIDADTGESEPQSVSMQSVRFCNVELVRGVESADPVKPNVDANVLELGWILCDTTGIVSVTQNTTTQVDNLGALAVRMSVIEAWRAIITGAIDTLRTDLANLARQLLLYTPLTEFLQLVAVVEDIYNRVARLEAVYDWAGTDRFLNENDSDTTGNVDGAYSARVQEGLRFPGGGVGSVGEMTLANPQDPYAYVWDGMMMPKPSGSRVRLDCSFVDFEWIEDRILQYVFWNPPCKKLKHSRWRHCCGPHFLPSPKSSVWWRQAQVDPCKHILSFEDEDWGDEVTWAQLCEKNTDEDDPEFPRWGCDRDKHYWRDWVHLPYWMKEFDSLPHSGQHVAQSFLNAQDGWLTGITLYLHRQYWQPISIVISGCNAVDEPDHANHTLAVVDLTGADLQACSLEPLPSTDIEIIEFVELQTRSRGKNYSVSVTGKWYEVRVVGHSYPVRIPIPPTFLSAGRRYAVHLISTYDHGFSICNRFDPFQVHQGHFWKSNGTRLDLWPGNINPKSLRFKLHYAVWGRHGSTPSTGGMLRYDIQFESLELSGGIGGIEVLTKAVIPDACGVSYQVKIGDTWYPFLPYPDGPDFSSNPTLLQFRVTMTGTTDLMPAISLDPSQVTLIRAPANSFHHISKAITIPASDGVKVMAKMQGFDAGHHTIVAYVHQGSTKETYDDLDTETLSDGTIQKTWTFTTLGGVTSVRVELDGGTDSQVDDFVVMEATRFNDPQ